MKKTILEIDLKALEHNFNVINSKLKPSTKFMAVVKANGYGSNSIEVAKKLVALNVDYFAVAFARYLRAYPFKNFILQKITISKIIALEMLLNK